MAGPDQTTLQTILNDAFVLLAVGDILFLWLNRDAALKRRLHPPIFILACGVLFADMMTSGPPGPFVVVLIVVFAIIIGSNLRNMRFCDSCGRTAVWWRGRPVPTVCSGCGAALEPNTRGMK